MSERLFHDSCFNSDIAVQSLINSPDLVAAEYYSVHLLYACFIRGDKIYIYIFFWSPSTRRVHLFNANRIKSEFLMGLIESIEKPRNLPSTIFLLKFHFITRNSALQIHRETTDHKNKPDWETKWSLDTIKTHNIVQPALRKSHLNNTSRSTSVFLTNIKVVLVIFLFRFYL